MVWIILIIRLCCILMGVCDLYDFLNNISGYPARLNIASKFINRNNELQYNADKAAGVRPWKYNTIAMATNTTFINRLGINALTTNPWICQYNGQTIPAVDKHLTAQYSMFGWSSAYNDTLTSTSSAWTGIASESLYFKEYNNDLAELVVYFKYEKISDYKTRKNNIKIADTTWLTGACRSQASGSNTAVNTYYSGFIVPVEQNPDSAYTSWGIIDTTDYDDYYIITDYQIYAKLPDVDNRAIVSLVPMTYFESSGVYLPVTAQYASNTSVQPLVVVGYNGLMQFAMTGTSVPFGESAHGTMWANPTPSSVYSSSEDRRFALWSQSILSTSILTDCYIDFSGATRLYIEDPTKYVVEDLDLTYCNKSPNYTNYKLLCVIPNNANSAYRAKTNVFRINNKWWEGIRFYNSADYNRHYPICAFKSIDDIKDYFADWGFKSTPEIAEAQYAPYETLPAIGGGTSPSGGDSGVTPDSGTNNTPITSIPTNRVDAIDDFNISRPNLTAVNLCQNHVFNLQGVKSLFSWFLTDNYVDNISVLFEDKLSAVYGLMLYPFDIVIHDNAHVVPVSQTAIANVINEDLPAYIMQNGYNTIIFGGEINYISYYGNFNDWANCNYSVYIPYGGIAEVPASAVVNRTLRLYYGVDMITGKATAILKTYDGSELGAVVKTMPCQIGMSIPIQASNYGDTILNASLTGVSMATSLIGGITSGLMGNIGGAISQFSGAINQGLNTMTHNQVRYSTIGDVAPSTGQCLPQTPFLCIRRCRNVEAANDKKINGLPTWYYSIIGNLPHSENITKIQNAIIKSETALDNEIAEMESLLRSGIYI